MKIVKKQNNSRMCIICGVENDLGLKAAFYEMENNEVYSLFKYKEIHQSYPSRVHGGMITAMLDELGFRAIWPFEPESWGVTINLEVKFRKPVPYDVDLIGIGKIIKNTSRIVISEAKIYDMDQNVLAEGTIKYLKIPLDKISEGVDEHEEINYYVEDDLKEINFN